MKNIFRIFAVAALACATFVACDTEFDDYTPGDPEVEGCYDVYFPTKGTALEFSPDDPTEIVIPIARTNAANAITVPITINSGKDVFEIEPVKFEAKQKESTVVVKFPKAELGKTYRLDITINDLQYASTYGTKVTGYSCDITRVKWNVIGTGTYVYNFWWAGAQPGMTLEQRDGTNQYRLQDWGGGVTLFFEMIDGVPTIAKQKIGDVHPSYGDVYIQSTDGKYVEEEKTYYFMTKYTVAAGSFGGDVEKFILD